MSDDNAELRNAFPADFAADATERPELLGLDDMLRRFAQVTRGPIIVDLENPRRIFKPGEFTSAYAHCKHGDAAGNVVLTTPAWAKSAQRKTADVMTFDPAHGQFFTKDGLRQLNTWIAPSWPRVEAEQAAPFIEHMEFLIPDETSRNDLLDWLAHAAQRPDERPHYHFLLIAQSEGIGRSWIGDLLTNLYGDRHAGAIDLHQLMSGEFNSELSGKIMLAVNEVRAPADERYSHKDRLKSLLTDTFLTVNEKHLPRWSEKFCARLLMFTNRDDALPLSETDRRVYAVRCAETPRSSAYYASLYGHLKDRQFLAAVWTWLRSRNLSKFNPGMRAPLNSMKEQMIEAGRTEEQQIAVDLVRACPHAVVGAADLMKALVPVPVHGHENAGARRTRTSAITAVLKDIGKQALPEKIKIAGEMTRLWVLRDASTWISAGTAKRGHAARAAHEDFKAHHWRPAALLQHWDDEL